MKFEKTLIPEKNTDYREVARVMEYNIKMMKDDISTHVDIEIARFRKALQEILDEKNPSEDIMEVLADDPSGYI